MSTTRTRSVVLLCFVVVVAAFALPSAIFAQPNNTAQPNAAQPDAAQPGADQPDAAAQPPADKPPGTLERLIYVPYKNLRNVFEKQGSTVFMPYLEYLQMWEKSFGSSMTRPKQPPVEAVITESHYTATINKDLAKITANFTVQVLEKPWAQIPIRFGNAAVGKLTSEGGKVLLRGTGQGTYSLLFPSEGEHKVQLELETRIRTSPDGRSFELNCPTVGVTTFEIAIPEADQTIDLTPQLVSLPVEAGEKETRIKANLGSTQKIVARWHPRVSAKPEMDLLASVTNHQLVSIRDGLVHADAYLQYDVLRGELLQARIAVPLGHRILGVASDAKVKGWKTAEEANRQVVTVDFLSAVKQRAVVEVHTERKAPDEAFDVSGINEQDVANGIHSIDSVRENGQLVVEYGTDLSLAVEQQQGLIRIDAAQVASNIRRANALYYKFYSPKFSLRVAASPVEPRITVNHRSQFVFRDDKLRLTANLQYTVERAGVFELRFKVDENLTIENVTGEAVKQHNVDDDTNTLIVTLKVKRMGALNLTITANRDFDPKASETEQMLPLLEPLSEPNKIERETGHVTVYAPEALEVITDVEKLVAAQPAPTQQIPPLPNVRLASAWVFNRRPVAIPVKTILKPTRLTATVGTTIDVQQELVKVVTLLTFDVQYAGIDTFRFSVPEAVSKQIQIRSLATAPAPAIKQKSPAEVAQDGWITWTVVMQRDVLGRQPFEITYDLQPGDKEEEGNAADAPADDVDAGDREQADAKNADAKQDAANKADGDANERDIVVQTLRALGLEGDEDQGTPTVPLAQVTGEIAVTKDRALSVSANPLDDDVEAIDVRELRILSQTGSLAYRYFKQPAAVKILARRHEIQKVVETVISRALVEIVVGRDQTMSYRCRYRLKSSERQRLRIDLPEGNELLGTLVNGKQVDPEKNDTADPGANWESLFINVARPKNSDVAFTLTIQFNTTLEDQLGSGGSLNLRMPRIGGSQQAGVVVQQLRTIVWVPDDYVLVGNPENFVSETNSRLNRMLWANQYRRRRVVVWKNWIGTEVSGIIDFPTEGHSYAYTNLGGAEHIEIDYWDFPFLTWVLSGSIVLIALVLMKTSWENRIGILLLAAFLATMYGLNQADQVLQFAAAAQWGLLTMVLFWFVHAFATIKPTAIGRPVQAANVATAAVVPPPGVFDEVK